MKKIISKFLIILAAVLLVTSCEWEPIKFDSSKSFVAFESQSVEIAEEVEGQVGVVVMVTALLDAPAITATFDFDTTGFGASAAVEGEDYTLMNDDKTLSFPDGWGYDTIWIDPIDNDVFTGDMKFNITLTSNSLDYEFGSFVTNTVTLKDNEHPLGAWIGSYEVDAQSYGDPENWDEVWSVTTSPVEGDVEKLSILGIGTAGTSPVIAKIDKESMTITIDPGQDADAYADYGYTEGYVYFGNPDLTLDKALPVVGTISEDGTITIDNFGIFVQYEPDPAYNSVWDVFNTTWTKTAKKATSDRNRTVVDKVRAK